MAIASLVATAMPFATYLALSGSPLQGAWPVAAMGIASVVGPALMAMAFGSVLRPLSAASRALRAYAEDGSIVELPKPMSGEIATLVESIEVVRERSEALVGSLARVANLDLLTNLPNRQALVTFAQRGAFGGDCAIAVVGVDHFRRVNREAGLEGGDAALRTVAKYLRDGIRSGDFVARLGGEDFVLVFPSTTPQQAAEIVDRIRRRLVEDAPVRTGRFPVSFSGGVCAANENESIDDLFRRADRLLAAARGNGRNRIETAVSLRPVSERRSNSRIREAV